MWTWRQDHVGSDRERSACTATIGGLAAAARGADGGILCRRGLPPTDGTDAGPSSVSCTQLPYRSSKITSPIISLPLRTSADYVLTFGSFRSIPVFAMRLAMLWGKCRLILHQYSKRNSTTKLFLVCSTYSMTMLIPACRYAFCYT